MANDMDIIRNNNFDRFLPIHLKKLENKAILKISLALRFFI
jgi:hypothetical protein